MKSILQILYEDGLCPSENPKRILIERQRLKQEHFALQEAFIETLTERQAEQFNSLWDQLFEDFHYGDCESFIYGFQLGARIMAEIMSFSPAPQPH